MSKPDIQRLPTRPRRQRPAARRDRGMALVFVLIMISIVFVIAAVSARINDRAKIGRTTLLVADRKALAAAFEAFAK